MSLQYKLYNITRGNENVAHSRSFCFYSPCVNNVSCTPYEVTLSPGAYLFEAWGSAGTGDHPGKGAYVKGTLVLFEKRVFYFFIGTKTGFNSAVAKSNLRYCPGGGATDVRLTPGEWDDFESLKSRILVAGGGGGSEWLRSFAGDAGLNGTTGNYTSSDDTSFDSFCTGGTQTSGGTGSKNPKFDNYIYKTFNGTFGTAGDGLAAYDLGGIGCGGYYGGASFQYAGAGGGGSSFVSGHYGCDAIHESSSSKENIVHTHQSVHYSRLMFHNTMISDGTYVIPHYKKVFTEKGNTEVGAIRITIIGKRCTNKPTHYNSVFMIMFFVCISLS